MNTTDHVVLATGAAIAIAGVLRNEPLVKIQRALMFARACNLMARDLLDGARSRLSRWPEHVAKAREF